MDNKTILIIGGGIGGLTSAIALRRKGFDVTVIERNSDWSVYGVGIIQQSNVLRAMDHLGLLEEYVAAGAGFDTVEVFAPDGTKVARVPSPRLVEGYPANLGVGRPALHKVLGDRTIASGAKMRLGVTATKIDDQGDQVAVAFSDGTQGSFDLARRHGRSARVRFPAVFPCERPVRYAGNLHEHGDEGGVGRRR